MRSLKKLGVLTIVVFALSSVGAANASAATFTASATGSLTGMARETQVFVFNGGKVECNTAETLGTISLTAATEQHVTVQYKGCQGLGFAEVNISPATYLLTNNGSLHIKNTITIQVNVPFFPDCHVTIQPQTVGTVDYSNSSASTIKVAPTISGIVYQTSELPFNPCGYSGNNGTYTGASDFRRVGGGTLQFDA